MSKTKYSFHRCRFLEYNGSAVSSLAFSHKSDLSKKAPSSLRLAVGRANGNIEIWRPKHGWKHEVTLYGGAGRSIESLCWLAPTNEDDSPRLFSIGGSSYVTEWSLSTGLPIAHTDCHAGPIWSMSLSPDQTCLAVGCANGNCVLFDVNGGVGYVEINKILTRQHESNILSLAWINNKLLVGGCSNGTLRVWNTKSSHGDVIARNRVNKKRKEEAFVWSIIVLQDKTIVSGDSTGNLHFWDEKLLSKQIVNAHDADILCLVGSIDGKTIFSTGVDQKLVQYQISSRGTWQQVQARRFHAHDVLTIAAFQSSNLDYLITGSRDTTLCFNSFRNFMLPLSHKLSYPVPYEPTHNIGFAKEANMFAAANGNRIDIWQLTNTKDSERQNVPYQLILQLNLNLIENISALCLSNDGNMLCVSTISSSRIFKIWRENDKYQIKKIENSALAGIGAVRAQFSNGSPRKLALAVNELCTIIQFSDDDSAISTIKEADIDAPSESFETKYYPLHPSVICFSPDDQYIALALHNGQVNLISADLSNVVIRSFSTIKSYTTALIFKPQSNILTCILATKEICEYDINTLALMPWSHKNLSYMHPELEKSIDSVSGAFYDLSNNNKLWVWGPHSMVLINCQQDISSMSRARKRRHLRITNENEQWQDEEEDTNFRSLREIQIPKIADLEMAKETDHVAEQDGNEDFNDTAIQKYKSLLFVNQIGIHEIAVFERPLVDILSSTDMPAPFYRHKYGT